MTLVSMGRWSNARLRAAVAAAIVVVWAALVVFLVNWFLDTVLIVVAMSAVAYGLAVAHARRAGRQQPAARAEAVTQAAAAPVTLAELQQVLGDELFTELSQLVFDTPTQ